MKYFIHLSVWRNSKEMAFILDRGGIEAYGAIQIICEVISEQMGMDGPVCQATLSLRRWARILDISPSKFQKLLSIFSESELCSIIQSQDDNKSVTIQIPKLWELRDEYSRKSRHSRDSVRRVSGQSEGIINNHNNKKPDVSLCKSRNENPDSEAALKSVNGGFTHASDAVQICLKNAQTNQ